MVPEVTQVEDTWHDNLQKGPLGQAWNLQITITGLADQIQDDIRQQKVVAVLDGSYQHVTGAVAWIIEGATSHNRIQGSMITPGNPKDHSSFQSKVAGVYSILVMLQWLLATDPRDTGTIKIACDGHSVLEHLQSKKMIDPFVAHLDLLNACKNMAKDLPCMVMYSHIKGHLDNRHPMVLSWLAWLNIEVDLLEKAHINAQHPRQPDYKLPNESWHIEIEG